MGYIFTQQAVVYSIAAVVLLFVAVVALAEVVARQAVRSGRYFVFQPGHKERYQLDPVTHPQLEPVVRRMINTLGERGGPVPRRGRVFRVLVVGGSVAECFTQDQDTQWPALLESRLRTPDALRQLGADNVHVGNIGRSGVDSRSLDTMLQFVLPNYPRLDLIIIMVGASDALRWLEAGAPVDRAAEALPIDALFARYPGLEFGWSPKRWGLAEWARRARSRLLVQQKQTAANWMGRARRDRANAIRFRDEAPGDEVVLESYRRHLRSVLRRSVSRANRVLVLGQPWFEKAVYSPEEESLFWNGAVGQAYKGTVTEFYSSRVICDLMGKLDKVAGALATEEHVDHLSLQGKIVPSVENFIDHFHFTPAGSRRIGELVTDAVLRATTSHETAI